MLLKNIYKDGNTILNYYEIKNDLQPLILIHAQGVDALSFANIMEPLSKRYHIYSIDCFGHGASSHDASKYNVEDISFAIISLIKNVIKNKVWLLGHSSGGLIAAYIAAETDLCEKLILEDPPFFSSQGERRKKTFNYMDLSTICHNFNNQTEYTDFVLYYFVNQQAWNFFPEKSREKVKQKLVKIATNYRKKHPDKNLKVTFWPKAALSGFQGMNNYDPLFGETFFDDRFHCEIRHENILRKIKCKTIFMKAKTNISEDGILMAALSDEDVIRVAKLIEDCSIERFACGHGIHIEKPREFKQCLITMNKKHI